MPLLHLPSWRAGVPLPGIGSIVAGFFLVGEASALTLEEARDRCRETVGRPIVQACMRGLGYGTGLGHAGGNWEADREGCRTKARPQVKACMEKLKTAVHGRPNLPVAIPEEETSPALEVTEKTAAFVPPPARSATSPPSSTARRRTRTKSPRPRPRRMPSRRPVPRGATWRGSTTRAAVPALSLAGSRIRSPMPNRPRRWRAAPPMPISSAGLSSCSACNTSPPAARARREAIPIQRQSAACCDPHSHG